MVKSDKVHAAAPGPVLRTDLSNFAGEIDSAQALPDIDITQQAAASYRHVAIVTRRSRPILFGART